VPAGGELVAVSIPPLAWFVDRLAGDAARVETLLPGGANPHSYEPSLARIQATSQARIWVRVGHPSFAFEHSALEALLAERPDLVVVDAAAGGEQAEDDPHVWLSPRRARGIAARIAEALQKLLPAADPAVGARLARLDAEIDALDRELAERLRPFRGRAFFAYHPDWRLFAEDYGLRLVALEEGHKEPDAKALRDRIEAARSEGARAIFVSPQLSQESAQLVAGEVGARVIVIDPLAYDWPATLRRMTGALAESFAE
jgi:zinc transport system substrate-binding protein